uniref:Uncharacterized protein n=1 Tax=Laticauda laticaudata TaxID=8630 RepID=A0A8C5RLX8_LATLA
MKEGPYLEQLYLHLVPHQVWMLPALPALQVVHGNAVGDLHGIDGSLQPQFLSRQLVSLSHQVLNLPLELRLPEVDVLKPLAHLSRGVLLGALGQFCRVIGQVLGLMAAALRVVAVGKGLVVSDVVVLLPFFGQELGGAEAGRGQTAGGIGTGVQSRLINLHGELRNGDTLRSSKCRP